MATSASQPVSVQDHNKQLLMRWFQQVWNHGNRDVIYELFAADGVIHDGDQIIKGPAEFEHFYDRLHGQFKDFHISPVLVIAEGDYVCMHWIASQTHVHSGKSTSASGTSIVRVQNGKFLEAWQNWDAAGLLAQLSDAPPLQVF